MTVTSEDIKKAKEILGLIKADVTEQAPVTTEDKLTEEQINALKSEYKDSLIKAEAAKATLDKEGIKVEDEIAKAVVVEPATAPKEDLLTKAINEKLDALTTVLSAKEQENDDLKKSISDLTEKVEMISKASVGPKSITTKSALDRFPAVAGEGERTLSISKDRRAVTAELVKAARIGEENRDDIFAKAASNMEVAGQIGSSESEVRLIAQRLKEKHKILLTA